METWKIPFPQANDMDKLYKLFEYTYFAKEVTKYDAIRVLEFRHDRQGYYYLNALAFLGLLEKTRTCYTVTQLGKQVMEEKLCNRFTEFCKALLRNEVVNFIYSLSNKPFGLDSIKEEVAMKIAETYNIGTIDTALRRIESVISWVKWIKEGMRDVNDTVRQLSDYDHNEVY